METKVAILVPCFNEENTISEVGSELRKIGIPFLIVNDGSTDMTTKLLDINNLPHIDYYPNQGKGNAIKVGALKLINEGYEYILIMDADGQHDIKDIEIFLSSYNRNIKLFIGNRLSYGRQNMPLVRYWTNRFMSWLISKKAGQYILDTQCGMRLIHKDIFQIPIVSDNFEYDSEILIKASLHGYKIKSVPIQCIYKKGRESKINPLRDAIKFFKMIRKF